MSSHTSEDPSHLSAATIRVLVVDDDPMVRQQVKLVLVDNADIEIVGEGAHGIEAVAMVKAHHPDVVLMDVSMPYMDGIEATREIRALDPNARVIALTALGDDEVLVQMIQAGAQGFVPKEYATEDLETAVQRVARGEGYVSPHSQPMLFKRVEHNPATARREGARSLLAKLSEREHAVARLVATGAKNAAIAQTLFVSESTVKSHLESIRTRLGVLSREEIAVLVERADLGAQ